ncbi:hypothetical protein CERSUDRAFT_97716 [Gelatoporia subvermispora B]|uniref:Uncharacterized protein n=1 Tax=Ceriporiopsis subvermispora (strain B) TaxID=914234 RepID=M2PF02_CERS8|nr:hypothetical protein CERSUDRAFT_97716 [Gelatoporia subvermispora B]
MSKPESASTSTRERRHTMHGQSDMTPRDTSGTDSRQHHAGADANTAHDSLFIGRLNPAKFPEINIPDVTLTHPGATPHYDYLHGQNPYSSRHPSMTPGVEPHESRSARADPRPSVASRNRKYASDSDDEDDSSVHWTLRRSIRPTSFTNLIGRLPNHLTAENYVS